MPRTVLSMGGLRRRRSPMTAVVSEAANDSGAALPGRGSAPAEGSSGDDLRRLLATLDPALEAMAVAAFVLSPGGEILSASAGGRALRAAEGEGARPSASRAWNLTPVDGGPPIAVLVILDTPPSEAAPEGALRRARSRWKLTARQAEVLELVVRGLTNELIAEMLGIASGTVEFHLSAIFDKAGVSNRATLISRVVVVGRQG